MGHMAHVWLTSEKSSYEKSLDKAALPSGARPRAAESILVAVYRHTMAKREDRGKHAPVLWKMGV